MSIWLRLKLAWSWIDLYSPTRRDGMYAGVAFGLYVLAVFVVGLTLYLIPDAPAAASHGSLRAADSGGPTFQLVLLATLLFAAVWEEVFVRNGLQKALYAMVDPRIAIVLSSAFFAALHLPAFGAGRVLSVGALLSIAVVFIGSNCIGWAYWKSNNILVAIGVHAGMNTLGWLSAVV